MGTITLYFHLSVWRFPETSQRDRGAQKDRDTEICAAACWNVGRLQAELPGPNTTSSLSPTAHHPTSQHGDPDTPSSGDEGEILSAEGPPDHELEPNLGEEEVVTPDFQEPLVSSGEEEPLILAEKQESPEMASPAPGGPTLASRPVLEAEEVRLSTVAPSPSSMEANTAVRVHTEATAASTTPRRRGRFKGLNGRHFQQQETQRGLKGALEGSVQPPTSEVAGNYVEPPLATEATDALGSGQSQSPWTVLTNEVDVPGAGEWGPRGRSWGFKGDGGGSSKSQLGPLASPSLKKIRLLQAWSQGNTQWKELLRGNYNYR